jgi:hypothetical protein
LRHRAKALAQRQEQVTLAVADGVPLVSMSLQILILN